MSRPSPPVVAFAIFLLVCLSFDRQSASADCRSFSDTIHHGAYGVADLKGQVLSSCNIDQPFVPASIGKIVTALAAFQILGSDHRFSTDFFLDDDRNLYIRGSGDPFLISEEVQLIAERLYVNGLTRVNGIFIDNSRYAQLANVPGQGTSDNPFDVPVAATSVNFNTVNIVVDSEGGVRSAEDQTPDLPLMREMGRKMKAGTYRLNICRDGCSADERTARYAVELFTAQFVGQGMVVGRVSGVRKVPANAKPVYTHVNSRNMEDVVSSFLEFSNNFVANQVFLACGAEKFGYPVDWAKAKKAVDSVLVQSLGADAAARIKMIEGAGLSRQNRITAGAMLQVLKVFRPRLQLLQEKRNGALKSGTLKGVYNYAGYLANGHSFVILLNQKKNARDVILNQLQDKFGRDSDE